MASATATDPAREYRLIEQLELRIASADTDAKFEGIIQKFLPALVLKLASEHERNRNLAIKVCQYVNQRLKISLAIQVPVQGLLKNFRESENAFVRRFSLIFIQQGLSRLDALQIMTTLPGVLQFSVPQSAEFDSTTRKMYSVAFDFLLDALKQWRVPARESPEEIKLKEVFSLSEMQCSILSSQLSRFALYDSRDAQPTDDDFKPVFEKHFRQRSSIIKPIASFLFTSIFTDEQRLTPATILSVDANASAASVSDMMFKQCNFDYESDVSVENLFMLYRKAKPKLQTRILSLLSKSQKSTNRTEVILKMVENQLSSPSAGLEASKLRTALFSYLTWAVRVSDSIVEISPKVQGVLKDYIEMQGWPNMTERSVAEAELRIKAYESIGLLAPKAERAVLGSDGRTDINLIVWLFTSLRCDTTKDIRSSIEEAIGRVMNSTSSEEEAFVTKLKDLLLWNSTAEIGDEDPVYYFPTANSTKYAAVRFANKALPFHDPEARLIDVLAMASSGRREIAEEGARGLDPYWHASNMKLGMPNSDPGTLRLPDFGSLMSTFFDTNATSASRIPYTNLPVLEAAITFCRSILICEAINDTHKEGGLETNWKTRIDGLVANDIEVRKQVKAHLRTVDQTQLGQLIQLALTGLSQGSVNCAEASLEILSLSPNQTLFEVRAAGLDLCSKAMSIQSVQLRAARCCGILASLDLSLVTAAGEALTNDSAWTNAIGEEAVEVRGLLLQSAFILTRASLRSNLPQNNSFVPEIPNLIANIITKSADQAMRNAAYISLGQFSLCLKPEESLELALPAVIDKLLSDGKKENEAAVSALGRLVGYNAGTDKGQGEEHDLIERIFGLHEVKKAEFHFALGEALAVAVGGFQSLSTITDHDVDSELPTWGVHEKLMILILDKIIESCKTTKPSLKKAAAIWLLSMIQYCGDLQPAKTRLRDCQAVFAKLLNDRDEIVQETGSRGLGLVYEKGDRNLRDDLVRDLVQSFTGTSAKMSGTVNEDTQLFDAGALPTEGGQSVTTYKDIVSLATEMGDPSLVYRFMNLASNNAIWTSRAAFGRFGLGNVLADSSYLTENKKFYPKLFRYRFDPNPNVQRSMNEIWRALVKDPSAVIDQHFDLIMEDLLKSVVSGREWRAREASCAAISDLVQGRDIEKYEKYLDEIWNVAFKVLDDVKETVRVAAMKLCRNLTNMLIRNLEVGEGTTKRAVTMLNHAMPFLLQQMENGSAKEVQQYAIVTLLEVVKKSPSKSLQPFAPHVLETLVNSLSSLEHESINYLHLNADKYGLTTEKLDNMRVSSINASPVTEAIDSCLESLTLTSNLAAEAGDQMEGVEITSLTPLQDAMQRLEGSFKSAIGLPSKVGLSRVIVTLVVRHQAAFRPFADRFAKLTRKHILDRNATISVAFSTSLGYLMRLASEKEIRATSKFAEKLYFESQDLSHRAVAGEIVQAISKTSNDIFMKFATTFLPFAFIGRNDTDEQVRERFDPPWKENIGGSRAVKLYLNEIILLISSQLKSSLWPIRHACCFAVAELVNIPERQEEWSEAEGRQLWPILEEALGGKAWDGKEKVVSAFPKFVGQAKGLWTDKRVEKQMRLIALREAKRTNVGYRPYSIRALGEFAVARKDLDLSSEVVPVLTNLMGELTGEDKMDVDEAHDSNGRMRTSARDGCIRAIVSCLFGVLSTHATATVLDAAMQILRTARAERSGLVDAALYEEASSFVGKAAENASDDGCSRRGTNQSGRENGAERAAAETEPETAGATVAFEGFLDGVVLALLSDDSSRYSSEPESQRRSRIQLGLVIAQSRSCSPSTRGRLASILGGWLQWERSRPLRQEIERAIEVNRLGAV